MFIRREPTSYYIYFEHNGRRTKRSLRTSRRGDITPERIANAVGSPLSDGIKLPVLFEQYTEAHKYIHTIKTQKAKRITYNLVCQRLNKICTTADIQEFIKMRLATSVYNARKDLINIRAVYNWSKRMKLVSSNPCDGIRSIKLPERQPRYFSRDEFDILIKYLTDTKQCDLLDIVQFLVNTGLRLGELLSLTADNLDLPNSFLILTNISTITKSKRVRTIPLNATAYRIASKRTQMPYRQLFTIGKAHSLSWIYHSFKRAVKACKLNDKYNVHTLRHTFASWLVQAGEQLDRVQALLGHADITTTQIYAHLRADNLREAVNKI